LKPRNRWQLAIIIAVALLLGLHPILYFSGFGAAEIASHLLDTFLRGLLVDDPVRVSLGLVGRLPGTLYTGQIAICLLGITVLTVYCVASVLFTGIPISSGHEKTEINFMSKYGWGRLKSILAIRAILILFFIPMITLCSWSVANAIFGWFAFHINDSFTIFWFPLFFVFLPGCVAVFLALGLIEYLVRDIVCLCKSFS
jgi:hypothetical protein